MIRRTKKTASGVVQTDTFWGYMIGKDGVEDVTVSVYEGLDNSGDELIPTQTYDGTLRAMDGAMLPDCVGNIQNCYVEITCSGTTEVFIYHG